MKYQNLIGFLTISGCCSAFFGLNLSAPTVQAAELVKPSAVSLQTVQKTTFRPNTSASATASSTESLGAIPSIDLAQMSRIGDPVLAQQSPTDLTPTQSPIEVQTPTPTEPQFPPAQEVKPNLETVSPGRSTRSGSSYIGLGANVGGFGTTSVGSPGLILYSKIGLTRYLSVRPAVVTDFSNDATFILPATFDLAPIKLGEVNSNAITVAPYIGAGATVSTRGDARPLLTGGVDVPINSKLTATLGLNTSFGGDVDLGGFIGVGYNF